MIRSVEALGRTNYLLMDLAKELGLRTGTHTYDRWMVKVGTEYFARVPMGLIEKNEYDGRLPITVRVVSAEGMAKIRALYA